MKVKKAITPAATQRQSSPIAAATCIAAGFHLLNVSTIWRGGVSATLMITCRKKVSLFSIRETDFL